MDLNTIDQQGSNELALLALGHLVGTRVTRRAVYLIAVLYLDFSVLYAGRIRTLGIMADQYLADVNQC